MKIKIFYILILIALAGILTPTLKLNALGPCLENQDLIGNNCVPKGSYQLLAPLPCEAGTPGCFGEKLETFDTTKGLGSYLNLMIKIFIGLCAVLSVVMIVVGGLEYMTSELVHSKEAGKEKITHAILGLLIALGAYALLFTINPDLLKSDINPPSVTAPSVVAPMPTPGVCAIQSATFAPSGTQTDTWYTATNKPDVIVDIVTKNCESKNIEISITEADGFALDDDLPDSGLDNRPIVVPTSNHIIMHLKAGEEACEGGFGDDCNYYITVYGLQAGKYESLGDSGGNLRYECSGLCLDNWTVGQIELPALLNP